MERHGECDNCGWCCQFLGLLALTLYLLYREREETD